MRTPIRRLAALSLAVLLGLVSLAASVQAQVDTGTILGTVKDANGAVISRARVTLVNTGTAAAQLPGIPDGWSEGFVYANGIRIHYYHAVPAPGKSVIVAVHGVMDTGLAWASVASKLQSEYDIYMLDTRGHGLSDPFTSSDDRNTLLKDVVAVAQKLGLEKPLLMGHSMGGATQPAFAG